MDFGKQIRGGLGTGLLVLAILLGLQISVLLGQLSEMISTWNETALHMDRAAEETLLTTQSVLMSVRGTTEQVRRSAEHQLGYYEAVGRRTSNLIAEMTFLIRSTNEHMEELTQAANVFLEREAEVTASAAEDFGQVAAQADATLAESGRLMAELREQVTAPEVQGSLEAIEASARNLETATAEAAVASRNTAEATGYIRDILSPKKKSFWRKLFELLIPRPAIAVR